MIARYLSVVALASLLAVPLGAAEREYSDLDALQKLAANGDARAKFLLARAYFKADGVPKDALKSSILLQEAAGQGNADAMDAIGFLYTIGEGVPKDETKAVEWFQKAADAGSLKGQLNLGLMLRQGKTIVLSNEKSLMWIHKSSEGGLMEATAVLGRLYFLGDKQQQSDPGKALPFLRKAAAAGDPICQNILGVALRDGAGTEKDPEAAETWFRKAAAGNSLKAQSNLAHLLGVESPQSPHRTEALKWLIISSEQGEITSRKTYDEILPTLPSNELASAKKDAERFLLLQRSAAGTKSHAPPLPTNH